MMGFRASGLASRIVGVFGRGSPVSVWQLNGLSNVLLLRSSKTLLCFTRLAVAPPDKTGEP